jgi:hypothetical protein
MTDLGWGWERVRCIIKEKFGKEPWYNDILSYLLQRYASIERRLIDTFRYVACHPENRNTFSYEYASILRDSGSVFSSVLDRLVRETTAVSEEPDISDYKKWLLKLDIPRYMSNRIDRIYSISVDINYPLEENVLLPFLQWKNEKGKLKWWEAYNNVKHSDVDNFRDGNLENAMNSVAALAVILALFTEGEGKLFINPGFYHPEEYLNKRLFFKACDS